MKPATPGFVGQRLKQARQARALSTTALAELVELSPAAISQYEAGKYKPGPDKLQLLAQTLNMPVEFFTTPLPHTREGSATFYRCMASATATARHRGERRLEWLQEIVAYLRTFMELPAVRFPECRYGATPKPIPPEEIEAIAAAARDFWNLGTGPISDVTLLMENNGAIVTRGLLVAHSLDAFSRWMDDEHAPYFFLGSDKLSAARHRFNVAHELAHILIHRHVPDGVLGNRAMNGMMEDQAHRFAAAFLVPAESFARELHSPTLDALVELKPRWNVSVGVMVKRMLDLEFIGPDEFKRLRIALSKRGWNRREPFDSETEPEEPRLLRRSMELLVSRGIQSRAQVRYALPFGARTVEDLACLRPQFLSDEQPEVGVLKFPARRELKRAESAAPSNDNTGAKVIDFMERKRGNEG